MFRKILMIFSLFVVTNSFAEEAHPETEFICSELTPTFNNIMMLQCGKSTNDVCEKVNMGDVNCEFVENSPSSYAVTFSSLIDDQKITDSNESSKVNLIDLKCLESLEGEWFCGYQSMQYQPSHLSGDSLSRYKTLNQEILDLFGKLVSIF